MTYFRHVIMGIPPLPIMLGYSFIINRKHAFERFPVSVVINFLKDIMDKRNFLTQSKKIREAVKNKEPLKIIIGSGLTSYEGWIATEKCTLNLLEISTWDRLLPRNSVDRILSEHVWEHLTEEEGKKALEICFTFLRKNGTLRLAVPDSYHPSKYYYEFCRPGGSGIGAYEHQSFYNYNSLSHVLRSFGDRIEFKFLEYYDEDGKLHLEPLNKKCGIVERTIRNKIPLPKSNDFYSSLIVDIRIVRNRN